MKSASDATELSKSDQELLNKTNEFRETFLAAMDDDFNTREAIATLFEFTRSLNKALSSKTGAMGDSSESATVGGFSYAALENVQKVFIELNGILGLFEQPGRDKGASSGEDLSVKLIDLLIDLRKKLRAEKKYELTDQIRDQLKEIGIRIEDTGNGAKWKIV